MIGYNTFEDLHSKERGYDVCEEHEVETPFPWAVVDRDNHPIEWVTCLNQARQLADELHEEHGEVYRVFECYGEEITGTMVYGRLLHDTF